LAKRQGDWPDSRVVGLALLLCAASPPAVSLPRRPGDSARLLAPFGPRGRALKAGGRRSEPAPRAPHLGGWHDTGAVPAGDARTACSLRANDPTLVGTSRPVSGPSGATTEGTPRPGNLAPRDLADGRQRTYSDKESQRSKLVAADRRMQRRGAVDRRFPPTGLGRRSPSKPCGHSSAWLGLAGDCPAGSGSTTAGLGAREATSLPSCRCG